MQNIELKEYIQQLNSQFAEIQGGEYVFLETGEIFTKSEVTKYIKGKIEEFNIIVVAQLKNEALNNGVEIDQRLYNSRSKRKTTKKLKDRYDGGEFNIVYRERIGEIMRKLNATEKGVWYSLGELATYPTNTVMIDGEIPSLEMLSEYVGMSDRNLRRYLKTLEDLDLIKSTQCGYRKAYVINPKYYATGKDLVLETLRLFDLIECDDNKVNEYLSM